MPWVSLPFDDKGRVIAESLSSRFGVKTLPTLILLDHDGNILSKDGRATIIKDPQGYNFPWKPSKMMLVRQASSEIHGHATNAGHTAVKTSHFNCLLWVVPLCYIIYFYKYGDSWGEDKTEDCEKGFPTWMLVMGIMGFLTPCCLYQYNVQAAKAQNENLGNTNPPASLAFISFLCLLLTNCFAFGWWIYGMVLLFASEPKCGKEMYELAFILFWVSVSSIALALCCGCLLACLQIAKD